jgi:hypothetical protein
MALAWVVYGGKGGESASPGWVGGGGILIQLVSSIWYCCRADPGNGLVLSFTYPHPTPQTGNGLVLS